MSSLGFCQDNRCQGGLCAARGTVCCQKCGTPHPDHPMAKEFGMAGKPQPKPVTVKHTIASNAAYQTDAAKFGLRIGTLETRIGSLAAAVERLEAKVTELLAGGGTQAKRGSSKSVASRHEDS